MFCNRKLKVGILQEVPQLLPQCHQCGMHMQAAGIFNHWQSDKCHKLTERQIRLRYVEMVARCGKMEFNINGEEVDERVEILPTFRYMGQPLDQLDDAYQAVRQYIMHARLVWGRVGTLLWREGVDPKVLAILYKAVKQAILLCGSETRFFMDSIANRI